MANPARDIRERVQRQWPGAIVVGRGRSSLTHQHPSDSARKRLDVALEPLHIAGTDIEIDTAWQPTTGAWQYEMTLADYQAYARNVLNAGDTIQYVDPGSGQSVTFQPLGLNWVNRDNSRQQIAQPGAVAAAVDDDILRWVDGYGAGRHFSWQTQTTRLQKLLTIDSPANLPAPAAWLGTGELWLELEFIIKNSAGVELYLDGVKWTRANNQRVRTSSRIEFRSLTTGAVLWYLDTPRAWDATGAEVIGQYEVRKQGGTHYITVRVPRAWLAAATYPVHVDPTITLQPDAAAGADTHIRSAYPNDNYGDSSSASIGCGSGSAFVYRSLLKFDLSSLPDDAILNSSILTLYQTVARANPNTIEIFRSKRAWVESQATWNNYATGRRWQEAGGFGANDCDATVIGSLAFPGSEGTGYRDFVLTPTTKADLDLGNGWLLKAKDEVTTYTDRTFATSDFAAADIRPRLVIEYTVEGGTDALTANGITAGTPTLGSPTLGQVHALTGTAIAAAAPVLGRPAIGQVHVLTAAAPVAGAPDLGTPAIGQVHVLTAPAIATGAPVLGAAAIGQIHALAAAATTAGRPILSSPIIGQIHALTAVTLEAQAPALDAPAPGQVHALTATAIVTGQPVLDAPSIEYIPRTVTLTALPITAGAPVVGSPPLGQVHALTAETIAAGRPVLGTPALVQIVALTAAGITAGAPQLTAPAIGQVHVLTAKAIVAGQPALGTPALVRIVALTTTGITAGAPQLAAPALGQVHTLTASGIVAGTPEAGRPVIEHVHVLVAALLLAGAPVLGAPHLFLGQVVTPTERIYTIRAENRTYTVAAENRTYTVAAENRTYIIRR